MHLAIGDRLAPDSRDDGPRTPAEDLEAVLDDPHCRYLLEHLRSTEGSVDVETLASHVVAGITDSPPAEVSPEVTRRVATWLHHGQLPTLDEYGVVEFDPEAGEVALGDTAVEQAAP